MTRTPAAAVVATLLAACGGADAEVALDQPVIDTTPTGVVHVRNTGPAAWREGSGWRLVLERTIRPADGAPGEIGSPRGIVADSRGHVYLYDRQPIAIREYGLDGALVHEFSGEGSGPGEISTNGLLMIARDTIVFHDPNQTRTQAWTREGEFLRGWSTFCCVSMPVAADRQGRIPVPGMVFPTTDGDGFLAGIGFVRYRLDGSIVDTVRLPRSGREPDKLWRFQVAGGVNINLVPMQPDEVQRLTPDGLPIWGHQSEYRFVAFAANGDTARVFTAPATEVAIPDSVRERVIREAIDETPELEGVAKLEDLPTTYAPWDGFAFDGEGNMWVLAAGPTGGTDHFEVFDPDGVLLGSVPSPLDRLYLTYWTADHVYALVEDEATGLPEVRIYRIERDRR